MHHIGTLTRLAKFPDTPIHAQCSCGTAGNFATIEDATAYLQSHFAKLTGMSTFELVDDTAELVIEHPVRPLTSPSHKPAEIPASEQIPEPQTVEQLSSAGPAGEIAPSFPEPSAPGDESNWPKKKKK
jgi:hypothetical protein